MINIRGISSYRDIYRHQCGGIDGANYFVAKLPFLGAFGAALFWWKGPRHAIVLQRCTGQIANAENTRWSILDAAAGEVEDSHVQFKAFDLDAECSRDPLGG